MFFPTLFFPTQLHLGRTARLFLVLAFVSALAPGCGGPPDYRTMDAVQKAKLVKQLHDEADYEFGKFEKTGSDPNGVDEAALFAYRDAWHQITEVMGPADYPLAYANYGAALSRVGLYHGSLVAALEKELETAKPTEQAAIRAKIEGYRAEAMKSFAASNRQLDVYFQNQAGTNDPKVYQWALGNSEALRDWKSALNYLGLLEANGGLSEAGKRQVVQLRKNYTEALHHQEEKELEHELKPNRASPGETRTRAETAN